MGRKSARSLTLVIGAVAAALAIGWSVTLSSAVHLLATVLVMGGTQHPLVDAYGNWADDPEFVYDYADDAIQVYVAPSGIGGSTVPADYTAVAVHTPEEFAPLYGTMTFDESVDAGVANLDNCIQGDPCVARSVPGTSETQAQPVELEGPFVVYGYSQSAVIATIEKRNLIERGNGESVPEVSFVLIANPNRPNGGVLQRFAGLYIPLLDVTFSGATPTDSDLDGDGDYEFTTIDVARQYDGWADFPVYPLNLVATTNALLGIYYLHGDYWSEDVGTPLEQGTEGDTTYYLIPTERLPLLIPFEQLGVPSPILTAVDAPLRVIVEWGYDRDPENVGTPTRARLIPLVNPVTGLVNLAVAIPTGLDDGLAEAAGDPTFRPLGTDPVTSPYGVGGEDLGPALGEDLLPEPAAAKGTGDQPANPVTNVDDDDDPGKRPAKLARPRKESPSENPAEHRPLKRLVTGSSGRPEPTTQEKAAETSERKVRDRQGDRDRFHRDSRRGGRDKSGPNAA